MNDHELMNARAKLLKDAGAKIVKAVKEYDESPFDAEYKLLLAIANNTAVIASMMFEDRVQKEKQNADAD